MNRHALVVRQQYILDMILNEALNAWYAIIVKQHYMPGMILFKKAPYESACLCSEAA